MPPIAVVKSPLFTLVTRALLIASYAAVELAYVDDDTSREMLYFTLISPTLSPAPTVSILLDPAADSIDVISTSLATMLTVDCTTAAINAF